MLYSHLHVNERYILTQLTNRRTQSSLTKYLPLTLLQGFEKVIQGLRVRGSWKPNRNFNILTSTLMAVNVVSFSFSWCSTGGPGVHSVGYWHLQHLLWTPTHRGSRGPPRLGVAFPTTSRLQLRLQLELELDSAELYNSLTSTRSLKSHV